MEYNLVSKTRFFLKRQKSRNRFLGRVILLSFLSIIFLGSVFLYLPWSTNKPISFFEAFFTSTSTVCVTGLQIIDMTNFTQFGWYVILLLMQIGGLGFMTLSFFVIALVMGHLGFVGRSLAGEVLNFESFGKIRHFIFLIIQMTLFVEGIGAFFLYNQFSKIYTHSEALFKAIFYSVSAFCNAGISLGNEGIIIYQHNYSILMILSVLVILGGLGFFVFYELIENAKYKLFRRFLKNDPCRKYNKLSLHTKIVLASSVILTLVGAAVVFGLENSVALENFSWPAKALQAVFYSISLRSVGFFTLPIGSLHQATLLMSLLFMIIGSAPGSTGGGIKTSTFAVFFYTLISIVKGKSYVEIGGRTIPETQVYRTISIITVAAMWVFGSTFILLLTESNKTFFDLFFEATSALATTGLSTGITASLSLLGKIVLILNMIVGRIGSLTFIFALRPKHETQLYKYPEERVLIG